VQQQQQQQRRSRRGSAAPSQACTSALARGKHAQRPWLGRRVQGQARRGAQLAQRDAWCVVVRVAAPGERSQIRHPRPCAAAVAGLVGWTDVGGTAAPLPAARRPAPAGRQAAGSAAASASPLRQREQRSCCLVLHWPCARGPRRPSLSPRSYIRAAIAQLSRSGTPPSPPHPHIAASSTMFLRTFAALAAALALASASLAQPAARSDLESRAPPCVRQKACPRGGLADQRAIQGPAGLGHVEHRLRASLDRVAVASPC